MKKLNKIFFTILVLLSANQNLIAQNQETNPDIILLQEKVKSLESENKKQNKHITEIQTDFLNKLKQQSDSIKKLESLIEATSQNLAQSSSGLDTKITQAKTETKDSINELHDSISNSTLYWIIAVLVTALITVILFFVNKKQIVKDKSDLVGEIKNTRIALEEEANKLDEKLLELLNKQLTLMEGSQKDDDQHNLALKVADEIIRIQQNLGNMDSNTKGLKQLSAAVKRIQDNFEAKGYELVEMLNKPYDSGMKVDVNWIPNEQLKPDEKIITRIIKPQVKYKGVMIQPGQVEVSINE